MHDAHASTQRCTAAAAPGLQPKRSQVAREALRLHSYCTSTIHTSGRQQHAQQAARPDARPRPSRANVRTHARFWMLDVFMLCKASSQAAHPADNTASCRAKCICAVERLQNRGRQRCSNTHAASAVSAAKPVPADSADPLLMLQCLETQTVHVQHQHPPMATAVPCAPDHICLFAPAAAFKVPHTQQTPASTPPHPQESSSAATLYMHYPDPRTT